jgi:hypothetical protein
MPTVGGACVLNLGPRQARKRLGFGLAFLAAGIVLVLVLWFWNAPSAAWLSLFVPVWLGLLGLLEARTHT